jgi:hypothetical protein
LSISRQAPSGPKGRPRTPGECRRAATASLGTAHTFPKRCPGSWPPTTSCRTRSTDTPRISAASAKGSNSDMRLIYWSVPRYTSGVVLPQRDLDVCGRRAQRERGPIRCCRPCCRAIISSRWSAGSMCARSCGRSTCREPPFCLCRHKEPRLCVTTQMSEIRLLMHRAPGPIPVGVRQSRTHRERVTGIEPALSAWNALLLHHTR